MSSRCVLDDLEWGKPLARRPHPRRLPWLTSEQATALRDLVLAHPGSTLSHYASRGQYSQDWRRKRAWLSVAPRMMRNRTMPIAMP